MQQHAIQNTHSTIEVLRSDAGWHIGRGAMLLIVLVHGHSDGHWWPRGCEDQVTDGVLPMQVGLGTRVPMLVRANYFTQTCPPPPIPPSNDIVGLGRGGEWVLAGLGGLGH